MDAGTVSGIAPDVDLSAAHGIAGSVPDVPADDDRPCVHGVSDGVLRVSQNGNASAIEVSAERVAGSSAYGKFDTAHAGRDEPLAAAPFDGARALRAADGVVQFPVRQPFRMYQVHIIPHPQTFFCVPPPEMRRWKQLSS